MSESHNPQDGVPDVSGITSHGTAMPGKVETPPSTQTSALERERDRVAGIEGKKRLVYRVTGAVIVVAAAAIIISNTLLTVLHVRGTSMVPTIAEGDIIVTNRSHNFKQGDILAFYYNNKILLKRVIGFPGDWIDIHQDGSVYVNGERLTEDYVSDLALGEPDISLPYQVPDGSYFVLGDHRSASIDSRSNVVGTVTKEQVIGKVLLCAWPPENFGVLR
ncbi:MAG: signal peptidase I [Atopobiaceae bacterium]|jgi:signal peptidase I